MKNLFDALLLFWTVYISSNILAMTLAIGSFKFPSLTRLALFLLFGWSCWTNALNAFDSPWVYIDYADSAVLPFKNFVLQLSEHSLKALALLVALFQLLIAVSMLLKGWSFKGGCLAGMLYCLALLPLGLYSGFPAPILMSLTFYTLFSTKHVEKLWIDLLVR